jgi:hypothetical protein
LALSWAIIFGSFTAVVAWLALEPGGGMILRTLFSLVTFHHATALPYLLAIVGFACGGYVFFRADSGDNVRRRCDARPCSGLSSEA